MFGHQLAIFSLLLVGLSLSSNLSEAVRHPNELFQVLHHSTDFTEIHTAFVELGAELQVYAELTDVREENCTAERILFRNRFGHLLGEGA